MAILDTTQVVARMNQLRGWQHITRCKYDIDIQESLASIEAIGKQMSKSFVIDDENRFAYENFAKWCNGDKTMQCIDPATGKVMQGNLFKGIYLAGGTGTGKSWCLDIMKIYCTIYYFKVKIPDYHTGTNDDKTLLSWQTKRADEICDEYMRTGDIVKYKNYPMLGIQDFGSEPTETLYMGNRVEVMKYLIESRGDDIDKLTFITSNLRPNDEDTRKAYGDRVVSRLREMSNYLEIKGRDRRR